jgi:penicillin-binding protein 2
MYIESPQQDVATETRIRWLKGIISGVVFIIILRLFFLQIIHGSDYQSLAENNRTRLLRTRTPRGTIYDRNGIPLASNRRVFSIFFDSAGSNSKEMEDSYEHLVNLLVERKAEFAESLKHQGAIPDQYKPQKLAEDVDFSTVAAIREQSLDLPGVYVEDDFIRYYPLGKAAAHLMGYLRGITEKELLQPQFENYENDDMIGRDALEKEYEQDLRGEAGGWMIEVDAKGRKRRDIGTVASIPGKTLVTNIDARLQQKAYELLEGKRGTIIAMDPNTGGILAMVSEPSFDPNALSGYVTGNAWSSLQNDPDHPMQNRAIMDRYPPGSVFKLITALSALENKKITPNTIFNCPGYFRLGNKIFHCDKKDGHGNLNLISGIANSCNVYFYHTAALVGLENIDDLANQFGLGQTTGIDLLNEQKGNLLSKDMIVSLRKEGAYQSETIQEGIGQGRLLVTPIQMVSVVATIANGGTVYHPYIVKQIEDGNGKIIRQMNPSVINKIELSEDTLAAVRKGMWSVVNAGGTGTMAKLPDIEVAGKTGTAQKVGEKDLAWFCGYAPYDKPEIVVLAMVEEGGFGGVAAAPLTGEMMSTYFKNKKGTAPQLPNEKEKPPQIAMGSKIQ